ncbi:hypothetical protein ECDEC6B_1303 [Escherichia coli DEC6B]|nr:hypothetical protein ECDEC6B_1303 [Escherichia coli DEC6B]
MPNCDRFRCHFAAKLIAPVHETEEELHQAYIDDKKTMTE